MATLATMLDPRNNTSDIVPLVIRITHKRKRKYLGLGYKLTKKEWNSTTNQITNKYSNSKKANFKIQKKFTLASETISESDAILQKLSVADLYEMIREKFELMDTEKAAPKIAQKISAQTILFDYTQKVITRYEKAGKYGSRDTFFYALNVIYRFQLNDDALWEKNIADIKKGKEEHPFLKNIKETLLLKDITEVFLEDLEADFVSRKNCRGEHNTLG